MAFLLLHNYTDFILLWYISLKKHTFLNSEIKYKYMFFNQEIKQLISFFLYILLLFIEFV